MIATTTTNRRTFVAGATALALSTIPAGAAHAAITEDPMLASLARVPDPINPVARDVLAVVGDGDYWLGVTLDVDLSYRGGSGRGTYKITGERRDGAWTMCLHRVLVGESLSGHAVITDEDLITQEGQIGGDDPLTVLADFLGGHLPAEDWRVIEDLDEDEHTALRLASPALRREIVALMQDQESFRRWFGQHLLSATPRDLATAAYAPELMDVLQRAVAEDLPARVLLNKARRLEGFAREYRTVAGMVRQGAAELTASTSHAAD